MAITDESRHELYKRLEDMMGRGDATTLMEHLPPVGWADVATRQDLAHLCEIMDYRFQAIEHRFQAMDARLDGRFAVIEARFAAVDARFGLMVTRGELHSELRKHTIAMAGLMVTLFGLFPLLYRLV